MVSSTSNMTPPIKPRIERESDLARSIAKNFQSSKQLLSKELNDRQLELSDKTLGFQSTSLVIEHLKSTIKTNDDKEIERLQQTCVESAERIEELEAEVERILLENETQHAKLQVCAEEQAVLRRKCDRYKNRYRKLHAKYTKEVVFKRSLARCLTSIGFSKDNFMAENEQLSPESPPTESASEMHNTEYDHVETPVRHLRATSEAPQPEHLTTDSNRRTRGPGINDQNLEPNDKQTSHNGGADEETITVARKIGKNVPVTSSKTSRALIEPEVRETIEPHEESTGDGDVNIEVDIPVNQPDNESEYVPNTDVDMHASSDEGGSSVVDDDDVLS